MGEHTENTLIFTDTDNGGIIHVANIKGGVGKSTVATNLAAALSRRGPTLLIDLDVQGSATVALGHSIDTDTLSSWELFRKRFSNPVEHSSPKSFVGKIQDNIEIVERMLFRSIIGMNAVTSLTTSVQPGLDLIPAGPQLFKTPSPFQLSNLHFNLAICREYYKYIVLDTPSVWNNMTRKLYLSSDLNLIPVTLNALSTKSLRDYLSNVRNLARQFPSTRLRIIKNEVYGKQDSKLIGKTRTMNENRKFLENLCEQVSFAGKSGISVLPQSIIFDLEIPESAIVRNAQDEGMSIYQYQQYGKVNKAFDELARLVQYVLNSITDTRDRFKTANRIKTGMFAAAAAVMLSILGIQQPVIPGNAPRPVAPQQLVIPSEGVFTHTFKKGESVHKLAKYAICRFRATVPSWEEINAYIDEVVTIHNLTRKDGEPKISQYTIPDGVELNFYPPMEIYNTQGEHLIPVYSYFVKMVEDPLAYVTGDWCERGTGGGQPHYGIDVACNQGSKIYAPISGRVELQVSTTGGRTLGIINNETVIFFCHMDKRFFATGDMVKQGQAVGTVGMTGRTSGPHAHIGYGIQSQSNGDMLLGKHRYRVTDPKLFFYREKYLEQVATK